ncbi:MAG: hypothetical protein K2O24_09800 [Muribaculaceae bacterium]|nr:hypothetical protein [Muribaculaceae bacterium]
MAKHHIPTFLLTLTALCSMTAAPAFAEQVSTIPGTWRMHPSFDSTSDFDTYVNHVEKVMDGPRFVFIWANAAPYYKGSEPFSRPCATMWYIDKHGMDENGGDFEVRHISEMFPTYAMDIQYADYNPHTGCLVIFYTDGTTEILHEDGRLVKGSGISMLPITPGAATKISHFTFDEERGMIYGAAGNYAFALDTETGEITDILPSDLSLISVARVGDRWVVCDEEKVFMAEDAPSLPHSMQAFHELEVNGAALPGAIIGTGGYQPWDKYRENHLPMPWRLLPVNERMFLYVMKNRIPSNKTGITTSTSELNYYVISVALLDNGTWQPNALSTDIVVASGAVSQYPNHPTDQMIHIVNTGYAVSCNTSTIKYNMSEPYRRYYNYENGTWTINPKNQVRYIPSSNPGSGYVRKENYDWQRRTCSYDHTRFWMYFPMKGMYYRNHLGSNRWDEQVTPVLPDAPVTFYADDFLSHPEEGMLIRNLSRSMSNSSSRFVGDQLSCWKDGKWTRKGIGFLNPELAGLNVNTSSSGRIDNPAGIVMDPLNHDWIYSGGYSSGMTRMNLNDPDDMLTLARENHTLKTLAGVVKAFPSQFMSYVSKPAFDNNNVLWTSFFNFAAGRYDNEAELYYWLPEDRMAVRTAEDYAAHPMRKLVVKNVKGMHTSNVVPLTYPGNDTKLVYILGNENTVHIIDHKGTLEDTSDDELHTIDTYKDDAGGHIEIAYNYVPVEDPVDGRVWIACERGLLWFDPAIVHGETDVLCQVNLAADPVAASEGTIDFYNMSVRQISFDPMGRKWISTGHDGVYVLSADSKSMLAHFTADNSGLPSNTIFGAGWDNASNSMFISTAKGIMQFTPSEMIGEAAAETVHAFPNRILPGFKGHVDITGVADGMCLDVVDASGTPVTTLEAAAGGRTQWHVASSAAREGIYWITDSKGNRLEKITIMK